MKIASTRKQRIRRKLRSRSKRPRLSVFVSNRRIYAQIVDDEKGETLAFAALAGKSQDEAGKVGGLLGQRAKAKKIKSVVFDRGGRKYHGRVKALAEAVRAKGVDF